MASSSNVARIWAKAGISNSTFSRQLKTRYDALLLQSISDGGLDKVTSATKNGVSMAKAVGLTVPEAMEAMQRAIEWIELGFIPSQSKALGRFF